MPIVVIEGMGRVELGDEFLKLSPEQQDATIQEIAASRKQAAQPKKGPSSIAEFGAAVARTGALGKVWDNPEPGGALDFVKSLYQGAQGAGNALQGRYTPQPETPGTLTEGDVFRQDTARRAELEAAKGLAGAATGSMRPTVGTRAAAPIAAELSPGQTAAATSRELGAPLPAGLASDNRGAQAVTQASRQLPFVGQAIEEKAANTVGKAGEAVTDLASNMGATNRAELGSNMRGALNDVVSANKEAIDSAYTNVREFIDPKAVFVPENTKKAFDSIVARRAEAGQPNPTAGLEQIENLTNKGINFDGMIRAKSDLAQSVDFMSAHAGFSNGDKKLLGAAMSKDLGQIASRASRPGVSPEIPITALRQAEGQASKLIESNGTINKLTANTRDEGLAGSLLSAASEKNGNLRLIAQLKGQLPKEHFDAIAGTALAELGHNPATGSFSLNKFYTNWEKLSPAAKGLMFPGQHGKFLADIAQLGKFLKGGEQYMNTSNTGRAAMMGGLITGAGTAGIAAVMGTFAPILGLGATVTGGYMLAKALAKPAAAASMARVAREAISYLTAPTTAKKSTLLLASRNAVENLANVTNVTPAEFLKLLVGPSRVNAGPGAEQPEAPRVLNQ